MPLYANNFVILKEGETYSPSIPIVEIEPVVKPTIVPESVYHEIKDESLHRIYNKKSSYLLDMIDIDLK
jgi:hypothetical protein